MTGIKLRYSHYRGSPPAMNDVIAGSIQMMFADPVTGAELAKAGKVRALGRHLEERVSVFPDVPPIADTVPGYEATNWHMILAPAQHAAADRREAVGRDQGDRRDAGGQGSRSARSASSRWTVRRPAELREFLDEEIATWGKLVEQIGLAGSL